MKKIIDLAAVLSAAFELWILASWVNMALVNCNPALIPAAWNIFNMI